MSEIGPGIKLAIKRNQKKNNSLNKLPEEQMNKKIYSL